MDAPRPRTNRDKLEEMCRAAGMRPEARETIHGLDLLLADGFALPPYRAYRKFGLTDTEFPHGAYVTFWALMKGEDRLFIATPLFFDLNHDMGVPDRKRARLAAARAHAEPIAARLRPAPDKRLH